MCRDVHIERDLIRPVPPPPEPMPVASLINGNAIDPGAKGGSAAKPAKRAENAQEDLLRQIERFVPIPKEVDGQLNHHALVFSHQLGKGAFVASSTALDERGLAPSELGPPDRPRLLHRDHSNNLDPRRFGKFRLPAPAPASRSPQARYDIRVKRALIVMALLAAAAVSGAVVYESAGRERDYRALLARGDAALAAGQTFAAIEDYSGAIALRPDAMLARLRRGETYRQRGDLDAAAKDFRAAADLDPSATRPLDAWGDALYRLQRYARAAEVYDARLRLDDRSASTRYKSALARYRAGDLNAALAALDLATRLDDQMADAHYLMGLCLKEQSRMREAMAAFERAVARAPGLVAAREELADAYAALGRRTDELRQLQVLAGLEGHRVERRVAVGAAHARTGQTDLAILTLGNAVTEAADQSTAYAALGRVWLDVARDAPDRSDASTKALEALARAASLPSATSEIKTLYGRALKQERQLEAAEQVFQQATERYPVDPAAFAEYAALAEHHRHYVAARDALISYHALAGDDAGQAARLLKIGQLSLRVNDPRGAVMWLQRAIAVAPNDPRAVAALADAQRELGKGNP